MRNKTFRQRLVFVIIIGILAGCDSIPINRSLDCEEIIIGTVYSYNHQTNTGIVLFEGAEPVHGLLKSRSHLPGMPVINSTLKNGRYFTALDNDSEKIIQYLGEPLTQICWFVDYRFQHRKFYIRVLDG